MKTKSLFYRITQEQYWEEIYSQGNNAYGGNIVIVNTTVPREVYGMAGGGAMRHNGDGFICIIRRVRVLWA